MLSTCSILKSWGVANLVLIVFPSNIRDLESSAVNVESCWVESVPSCFEDEPQLEKYKMETQSKRKYFFNFIALILS